MSHDVYLKEVSGMPQIYFGTNEANVPLPSTATKSRTRRRPRLGLVLITLSGLAILWIPVNLHWLAFVSGSFASAGILYGTLIICCAVLGWILPQYVRILGVFTMILSILSIIGALGGLIVGALCGIIGAALCIAWSPTAGTLPGNPSEGVKKMSRTRRKAKPDSGKKQKRSKSSSGNEWTKWL